MERKRRNPTANFKLPSPYNPVSGEQAPLVLNGVYPYTAMMQVAAEDTHQDYVICRGFDVRIGKFIDYASGDSSKPGIPVAKPYGKRSTGSYTIAQVYPAILPLQTGNPSPTSVPWRVGQNPGVAATTAGHPADLNETIEILYDTNNEVINWMLLDAGDGATLVGGCLAEDHPGRGSVFGIWLGTWSSAAHKWSYSEVDYSTPAIDWRFGVPYPEQGATGLFQARNSDDYGTIWEVVALDCDVPTTDSCGSGSLPPA